MRAHAQSDRDTRNACAGSSDEEDTFKLIVKPYFVLYHSIFIVRCVVSCSFYVVRCHCLWATLLGRMCSIHKHVYIYYVCMCSTKHKGVNTADGCESPVCAIAPTRIGYLLCTRHKKEDWAERIVA